MPFLPAFIIIGAAAAAGALGFSLARKANESNAEEERKANADDDSSEEKDQD